MDEPWKYYATLKKPVIKDHLYIKKRPPIIWSHLWEMSRIAKTHMPRGQKKKKTYKTFLREIEKLISGETDFVHRWKNYTAEILLSNPDCRVSAAHLNSSSFFFFKEIDKLILKFIWRCKGKSGQDKLEKDKQIWKTYLSDFKTYCEKSESHSVVSNSLWPRGTVHGILQAPQGLNPSFPHCRRVLYHLSHQGSPRIPTWVTYPFSNGCSQPRNQTGVSCIAGRFFTSWATRKPYLLWMYSNWDSVELMSTYINKAQKWNLVCIVIWFEVKVTKISPGSKGNFLSNDAGATGCLHAEDEPHTVRKMNSEWIIIGI